MQKTADDAVAVVSGEQKSLKRRKRHLAATPGVDADAVILATAGQNASNKTIEKVAETKAPRNKRKKIRVRLNDAVDARADAELRLGNEVLFHTANARRLREVRELLNCPVSLTPMTVPVMMPCGHTVDYQSAKSIVAMDAKCPLCRAPINAASDSLPLSLPFIQLWDIVMDAPRDLSKLERPTKNLANNAAVYALLKQPIDAAARVPAELPIDAARRVAMEKAQEYAITSIRYRAAAVKCTDDHIMPHVTRFMMGQVAHKEYEMRLLFEFMPPEFRSSGSGYVVELVLYLKTLRYFSAVYTSGDRLCLFWTIA